MTQLAPKPESDRERLDGEILWFEALQDLIEDGDLESARLAIAVAILLKRREAAKAA